MSRYDGLSCEQLISLIEKRDRTKKLGLVWKRDEIEADNAVGTDFMAKAMGRFYKEKLQDDEVALGKLWNVEASERRRNHPTRNRPSNCAET